MRNHKADLDRTDILFITVKYQEKWWNLCDTHYEIYDDIITYVIDMSD